MHVLLLAQELNLKKNFLVSGMMDFFVISPFGKLNKSFVQYNLCFYNPSYNVHFMQFFS